MSHDPVGAGDLVRTLVDDLEAEVGEQRQHRRQRERATPIQLEPTLRRGPTGLLIEVQPDGLVGVEGLEVADVQHGDPRAEVLLVGLGERAAVEPEEAGRPTLAVLPAGGVGEVLFPRPGGFDQALLQIRLVDRRDRLSVSNPDHEVQTGQHRLRYPRRVVHAGAMERVPQDRLHLQSDSSVETVTRNEDQTGHEAAVLVLA